MKVRVKHFISVAPDEMTEIEVKADSEHVWIKQSEDTVLVLFAAVPALIEALQAAAKEAGDE